MTVNIFQDTFLHESLSDFFCSAHALHKGHIYLPHQKDETWIVRVEIIRAPCQTGHSGQSANGRAWEAVPKLEGSVWTKGIKILIFQNFQIESEIFESENLLKLIKRSNKRSTILYIDEHWVQNILEFFLFEQIERNC